MTTPTHPSLPPERLRRNASAWQRSGTRPELPWNERTHATDAPGPPIAVVPGAALPGGDAIDATVGSRFAALARRWREETEFESAPGRLFMHPAYQEIIGLGPEALPHILRDLAETRAHWFWALRAITGEDPVSPGDRGHVARMTHAWLAWGEARGLP